jgi:hypothetical protein
MDGPLEKWERSTFPAICCIDAKIYNLEELDRQHKNIAKKTSKYMPQMLMVLFYDSSFFSGFTPTAWKSRG